MSVPLSLALYFRMFLVFHWANESLQKGCLQTKKNSLQGGGEKGGGEKGGGGKGAGGKSQRGNSIKQANRTVEGLYGQYRTGKLLNFSAEMSAYRIIFTFFFLFYFLSFSLHNWIYVHDCMVAL